MSFKDELKTAAPDVQTRKANSANQQDVWIEAAAQFIKDELMSEAKKGNYSERGLFKKERIIQITISSYSDFPKPPTMGSSVLEKDECYRKLKKHLQKEGIHFSTIQQDYPVIGEATVSFD